MRQTHQLVRLTLLILTAAAAQSQTTTSTTTASDPQLDSLKSQQAVLDAKVAILQDQQKLTTGALPGADIKPKEGSIKTDGDHPIESLVLAYTAARAVAVEIATQVSAAVPAAAKRKVVIYDQTEINSLLNYQAFTKQLTYLQTQLAKVQSDAQPVLTAADAARQATKPTRVRVIPPTLIPGLVEGAIKSVIDIIGLFKTDTEIHSKDFTPDDGALIAATASALTAKGCSVYQPSVFPVTPFESQSQLLTDLTTTRTTLLSVQLRIQTLKNALQQHSDALARLVQASKDLKDLKDSIATEKDPDKKMQLQAKLPAAESAEKAAAQAASDIIGGQIPSQDAPPLKDLKDTALKSLDPIATAVTSISTTLDAFQTVLFKADDAGNAALSKLLRAEKLYAGMTVVGPDGKRTPDAYVLVLKMAVLGGGVKTKTNFFIPTRLYYSGGSIATFTLFAPQGEIIKSGTTAYKSAFIKANQRNEAPGDFPTTPSPQK